MSNIEENDFYLAVGVLGGVVLLLLFTVIGLIIWSSLLQKKINKMEHLADFKLQRPQLKKTPQPQANDFFSRPPAGHNFYPESQNKPAGPPGMPKSDYNFNNPGFRPASFRQPAEGGGTSLNPLAHRGQNPPPPVDNRNFSYGPGANVPNRNNNMPSDNSRFASDRW